MKNINNTNNSIKNEEEIKMTTMGLKLAAALEKVGGKDTFLASVEEENKTAEINDIAAAIADAVVGALHKVAVKAAHKLVKTVRPFVDLLVKAAKAAETADWETSMALWGVDVTVISHPVHEVKPVRVPSLHAIERQYRYDSKAEVSEAVTADKKAWATWEAWVDGTLYALPIEIKNRLLEDSKMEIVHAYWADFQDWRRWSESVGDFVFDLQRFCAMPALKRTVWASEDAIHTKDGEVFRYDVSRTVFLCGADYYEDARTNIKVVAGEFIAGKRDNRDEVFYKDTLPLAHRFPGAGAMIGRQVSNELEVGQVITGFNSAMTLVSYAKALADELETTVDKLSATDCLKYKKDSNVWRYANVIFRWFEYYNDWGTREEEKDKADYVTPLFYSRNSLTGQLICYVTPETAKDVVLRIRRMPRNLPLDQVMQAMYDLAAVKRMNGEAVIDGDKKPDPKVLAGIFGFEKIAKVQQQGKQDITVAVRRQVNNKGEAACTINGDVVALTQDKRRSPSTWFATKGGFDYATGEKSWGGASLSETFRTKKGALIFEDFVQNVRVPLFRMLANSGCALVSTFNKLVNQDLESVKHNKGQRKFRLPDAEQKAINAAFANLGQNGRTLVSALQSVIKDFWSSGDVFRETVEFAGSTKHLADVQSALDKMSAQQKDKFFRAVSNQTRLLFEAVGVNDPVKRIRMALFAAKSVTGDKGNAYSFCQSALAEEFVLWLLNLPDSVLQTLSDKSSISIARETTDVVTLVGAFANMSDERKQRLSGKKINFANGVAFFNGRPMAVADSSLTGYFALRVSEEGTVTAHCPISELITVPAADQAVRYVKLVESETKSDIETAVTGLWCGPVRFTKDADRNPVIVEDEQSVVISQYYSTSGDDVNSVIFSAGIAYDAEKDEFVKVVETPVQVKAVTSFVKEYSYDLNGATRYGAFALFRNVAASNRKWR